MATGKIASQAGHAYLNSYLTADPALAAQYQKDGIGTKVCLRANSLPALLSAHQKSLSSGLPCSLITDSGCANFFGGEPTITALGIGPCTRAEVDHITRKFQLEA